MTNEQKNELNQLFEEMVKELEIPSYIFDNLKTSYEALGEVLNADDSDELKGHKVVVHYQGSIGLGTAIRPLNEEDDVDVDMICEVQGISGWTQYQLKQAVGNRLKSRETYRKLLDEEGTRCWKLLYRQNSDRPADRYHVDILPATVSWKQPWADLVKNFTAKNNPNWAELILYITDNKRWDYKLSKSFLQWLKSNPLAYRLWFEYQCQRDEYTTKSIRASVDPFPKVSGKTTKTVLQKVVMLLKRHRDVRYGGDEDKPISCIITTLAALAYRGERDITSALTGIAARMRSFIKEIL